MLDPKPVRRITLAIRAPHFPSPSPNGAAPAELEFVRLPGGSPQRRPALERRALQCLPSSSSASPYHHLHHGGRATTGIYPAGSPNSHSSLASTSADFAAGESPAMQGPPIFMSG